MPTTASGLTFYDEEFETGFFQGLTQMVDGFNAASGGAIILEGGAMKGRNPKRTIMQARRDLIQNRDPSGSGNLTPVKAANAELRNAKCWDSAPLTFTSQDWEDYGLGDDLGTFYYGENFGQLMAERLFNSAVAAVLGAIGAIDAVAGTTAIFDATDGTLEFTDLNQMLGLMGDRRPNVRTAVVHSKPLVDWIGNSMTSQAIAFQMGGVALYNGGIPSMNLGLINSDSAPLLNTTPTPDEYTTLGLVPGAVRVKLGPQRRVFSFVAGTAASTPENHTWLLSIESSFEIEVLNCSFTAADTNPSDATLATAGSWTEVTAQGSNTDVKNGPGVAVTSQ